ncbi:hypothetical protein NSTC745_04165 [Nostoc sp. DSM 114161]|jgi:hypothetical protein|uniref:hypothetical protein n=1 Tax=Nostoc sp. DSM 114161 TaxID=3440143 RepID=UPI004045D747
MKNHKKTNVESNNQLPIEDLSDCYQKLSQGEMQNIRGGLLISDYTQNFQNSDGYEVWGNVIYSGEGLPWQTGGSDSDYIGG